MRIFGASALTGHLGSRVSAFVDGQLNETDAQRVIDHLEVCVSCVQLVERERWVKNRLSALNASPANQRSCSFSLTFCAAEVSDVEAAPSATRGWVIAGGSALGAAVVGVIAFGAAPASAPTTLQYVSPSTVTPAVAVARSASNGWLPTNARVLEYIR